MNGQFEAQQYEIAVVRLSTHKGLQSHAHRCAVCEQKFGHQHSLNILASFDLVLLGDWEADPIQRRALLSLIMGPNHVWHHHNMTLFIHC